MNVLRSKLARLSCLTGLVLAATAAVAQPDAFWCSGQLVREGLAAVEIVRRCGEPNAVELIEEPIMARNYNGSFYQVGVKVVEVWTYDRGSRSFPARILVEDGIATEVELVRQ